MGIKGKLRTKIAASAFLAKWATFALGWFDREVTAVMAGVSAHKDGSSSSDGRRARLVRNTHRIEKGLIHRVRRSVFGMDYLPTLITDFEILSANVGGCNLPEASLVWSRDVLAEYFSGAGSDPKIDSFRVRYERATATWGPPEDKRPYLRNLEAPAPVSYNNFLALCQRRRSVRWFLDKPVSRDLLDKALMAARQSPSACNRQPFFFWVADDRALAAKLGSIPGGTAGFAHNFPCVIALVGDLSAYSGAHDRHVIYIDGSLAAMSFSLALETLGLSSCIINWPDHSELEDAIRAQLPLKIWQRVVFLIAVGYPDPAGKVPFSEKKSIEILRRYNLE